MGKQTTTILRRLPSPLSRAFNCLPRTLAHFTHTHQISTDHQTLSSPTSSLMIGVRAVFSTARSLFRSIPPTTLLRQQHISLTPISIFDGLALPKMPFNCYHIDLEEFIRVEAAIAAGDYEEAELIIFGPIHRGSIALPRYRIRPRKPASSTEGVFAESVSEMSLLDKASEASQKASRNQV